VVHAHPTRPFYAPFAGSCQHTRPSDLAEVSAPKYENRPLPSIPPLCSLMASSPTHPPPPPAAPDQADDHPLGHSPHEPEALLVGALGLGVQFCEAPVGAVFSENPIEGAVSCHGWRWRVGSAAAAPAIKRRQQDGFGACDSGLIIGAEWLILERATGAPCPCWRVEEVAPAPV
jgi:hypothetical protein